MDTGLVCYLIGWKTKEQLKNGAMAGSIFETFVFANIGYASNTIHLRKEKL